MLHPYISAIVKMFDPTFLNMMRTEVRQEENEVVWSFKTRCNDLVLMMEMMWQFNIENHMNSMALDMHPVKDVNILNIPSLFNENNSTKNEVQDEMKTLHET
jgi:hypothetical protein